MDYYKKYEGCMWVPFDTLAEFMATALTRVDVPRSDAEIIADVLITSDKRGIDSHGISRLKSIYIDRILMGIVNPHTRIDIYNESPATGVIDGNNGMGHVISVQAMELAVNKAEKCGMGMIAVRNSSHYGIAGYYPLMAVKKDMIGITGTNARPSIAPTFSVENMLGTNPLTVGIPTDEEFPFLLDCATSIAQRGKIEVYSREGKELPKGWVIGENGEIRTDASGVLRDLSEGKAALCPVGGPGEEGGGYKGYGYAAVVEILSAALQNGNYLKALTGKDSRGFPVPFNLGHFFIAIDIKKFIDPSLFKKISGSIVRDLRNAKKAPGAERIYTAGEKEHEAWLFRKERGCPLSPSLVEELRELCDQLEIPDDFLKE